MAACPGPDGPLPDDSPPALLDLAPYLGTAAGGAAGAGEELLRVLCATVSASL